MSAFPTSPRAQFLAWCQQHVEIFTEDFAQIGITSAQALAFATAVSTAAASEQAAGEARNAAKAATNTNTTNFSNLRRVTGDTIRSIRAYAELQGNPNAVYNLAQVPPPATPSPAGPPDQPHSIDALLKPSNGSITLTWKATNPASGTSYIIKRKMAGQNTFTILGVASGKSYTDTSLTAGIDSVQYTVTGTRAGIEGPESQVMLINFGRAASGQASIVSQTTLAPKLAA